jgi:hypothetical protein
MHEMALKMRAIEFAKAHKKTILVVGGVALALVLAGGYAAKYLKKPAQVAQVAQPAQAKTEEKPLPLPQTIA